MRLEVADELGIIGNSTRLSEMSVNEWDNVIGVNLTGVFNCIRVQVRLVEDGGSIVNIASVGGKIAWEGGGAYCTSKHGVIGLTKAAAREVAHRAVRVNAVCPYVQYVSATSCDSLTNSTERSPIPR